ncbi:MAG: pyridoxal phosphate-dependent aminotransferase [Myxococcota bacterium]|nr:pyridoxal phosphate-dependent aminotransferase [Myxococcota bacterium]
MPRHPEIAPATTAMSSSLFSKLADRIQKIEGDRFALHVGDTWLQPADGARMEDFRAAEHPGLNRYTVPHGHPRLIEAIVRRREVEASRVLVTAGATGGLGAIAGALLAPGDEVLVLAPFWPLIRGIVLSGRGLPVQIPFYDRLSKDPGRAVQQVDEILTAGLSPRSVALYVNTPNNPTGRVLPPEVLAAIADFARRHNLWLWSDEVYEDYAWARPHQGIAPYAPERTFEVYSFSKAYGMAGNRCGYIVGPEDSAVMEAVRKISTHTFYSAPTAAQLAAAQVLNLGADWLAEANQSYRSAGIQAAEALGLPPPEGGTFLFIDVSSRLDDRGLQGFLEDCIDRGLILAPGTSCGDDYPGHVRLCFTCEPPDVVARGVAVLADILSD